MSTPKQPNNSSRIRIAAVLAVTGLLAVAATGYHLLDRPQESEPPVHSQPQPEAVGAVSVDSQQIVDDAILEMEAIANQSASAWAGLAAEASALAEAEANGTAQAASEAVARASAEAAGAVASAGDVNQTLGAAPEDYVGGDVEADTPAVEDYETPEYTAETDYDVGGAGSFNGTPSSVGIRGGLNLPVTGVEGLDAAFGVLAEAYVEVRGTVVASVEENETSGFLWNDDDLGTAGVSPSNAFNEGEAVSYSAAPDEEGAAEAWAHANATLEAAGSALATTMSGVNVTIEVQSTLAAEVQAEIEQSLEAAAEAEANITAEADARVEATFAASAEAEAELHAQAEQQIEVIRSVQLQASKQVQAEAQKEAALILDQGAAASQQLEAQAGAVLEQAAQASAAIRANLEAALELLAAAEETSGTSTSAQAQALARAATAAEARVWAQANAQADALVSQASAATARAQLQANAVIQASANAQAAVDAKAEVAVRAVLRAEAYAVAKVHAEAQATAKAHIAAAASALFKVRAEADAHIRLVLSAAVQANAAAKITLDGGREVGDNVGYDTDVEVQRDIDFIREVEADYARQQQLDTEHREEHWHDVANELTADKDLTLITAYELITDVDYGYWIVAQTAKDLELLEHQYL